MKYRIIFVTMTVLAIGLRTTAVLADDDMGNPRVHPGNPDIKANEIQIGAAAAVISGNGSTAVGGRAEVGIRSNEQSPYGDGVNMRLKGTLGGVRDLTGKQGGSVIGGAEMGLIANVYRAGAGAPDLQIDGNFLNGSDDSQNFRTHLAETSLRLQGSKAHLNIGVVPVSLDFNHAAGLFGFHGGGIVSFGADLHPAVSIFGGGEAGASYGASKGQQSSQTVQSNDTDPTKMTALGIHQVGAGDLERVWGGLRVNLGQNTYLKGEVSYEHDGKQTMQGTVATNSQSHVVASFLSAGGAF